MAAENPDPLMEVTPDKQGNTDVTGAAVDNGYLVEYLGVPMMNTLAEAMEDQENKMVG
jgi:hypothetical protein